MALGEYFLTVLCGLFVSSMIPVIGQGGRDKRERMPNASYGKERRTHPMGKNDAGGGNVRKHTR